MTRRFAAIIWGSALAVWMLAAMPTNAVEFRGRTGARAPHRYAALQIDDEGVEPSPSDMDPEEMPEETPEEMPESKPAPVRKPPQARKPTTTPPKVRPQPPFAEPMWDTGPMPGHMMPGMAGPGGPCSDGFCQECPPISRGLFCNGAWGSVEYLLWWRAARSTPPLVTTTTRVINQDVDAELGQPNTRILLGDGQYGEHLTPGGRIDAGYWLDACQSWGLGVRFAMLGDDDLNYLAGSAVNPVLAVPFFNLDPAVNSRDTLLVAHPLDNTSGSIRVQGHNEVNMGDIYVRLVGTQSDRYRIDIIGGYMFSNIIDDLTLRTSTTSGQADIVVRDHFRAKNQYHGGSIGLMGQFDRGPWLMNLMGKVGLTNVEQTVTVDGLTTIDGVTQASSGLYAQPSNSGTISRNQFAAIPEVTANWVYKLGGCANLSVGYSAVYWSDAALAGDQMNPLIDPTQTAARPPRQIVNDSYFVHGLNFGLAWQY